MHDLESKFSGGQAARVQVLDYFDEMQSRDLVVAETLSNSEHLFEKIPDDFLSTGLFLS